MPGGTSGDEAIKHVGKRRVRISGRFFPNGSSAVSATSNQGKAGWSVAWISTGLFRITLDRRYLKVFPVGSALQLSAAAARWLQWGDIVSTSSGHTIDLRVIDATGTVQNVSANANNSIGFDLEAVQDTVQG